MLQGPLYRALECSHHMATGFSHSEQLERERDRETDKEKEVSYMAKVTHHHFYILFVGSESLSPVHTQSERLGSSLAGKSIKEFVGSF